MCEGSKREREERRESGREVERGGGVGAATCERERESRER